MANLTDKANRKPRLYIDVDGVILGLYGEPEEFQMRPAVNSFLRWADEHFECVWLTAWGARANALVRMCQFNREFPAAVWHRSKTEGIDFTGEWFWIDDDLLDGERVDLEEHAVLDRHIRVDLHGSDALVVVRRQLELRLRDLRLARVRKTA
jgi:hypothetical protein